MRSGTLVGLGFFLGKRYPPSPTCSPRRRPPPGSPNYNSQHASGAACPSSHGAAWTKSELQLPACPGHTRGPGSAAAVEDREAPPRQPLRCRSPSLGRVRVEVGSCPRHAPRAGPGRCRATRGPLDAGVWERDGGPGARGGLAQRHGDQTRAGHEARHGRGGRGGRRLRRGPHRPR